jgi:beta-xylosidase
MRHSRVVTSLFAGMVAVAGLVAAAGGPAFAASSTFNAPVYAGDFPDPSVVLVNGTYWAYATGSAGRNLQAMSSTDLHTWSSPTDPLPVLPSWASSGRTWAPGVLQRGTVFLMYYTVHDTSLGQQCISVATSASPGGVFKDVSTAPLICQSADGGSIDPNPYVDPASGNLYLFWKSDDNSLPPPRPPTRIWGQRLTGDGMSVATGTLPSLLLTESAAWQSPAVEGPTVIRHSGLYYLFYGANNFDAASSGIGYATSPSLLGSFTDQSTFGPWLGTRGNAQGPQGPMVFKDATGATRMAFAAWYGTVGYENGGARSMWVGTLGYARSGRPTLS